MVTRKSRIDRYVEVPGRLHALYGVARFQILICTGREQAIGDALDRDAQMVLKRGRTNGIGAANLFSVKERAQREVLPLYEPESLARVLWHFESNYDCIAGFVLAAKDS